MGAMNEDQPTSQVAIAGPAPVGVWQGSASPGVGCVGGGQTVFYYVIARFPSGLAYPPNGAIVARNTAGIGNLSVSNFNVVSWPPVSGATGYDVLRHRTRDGINSPCASCAVVLNTTATTVNDTGQNGGGYPPAGILAAQDATGIIQVDNTTAAAPFLTSRVGGNPALRNALIQAFTAGQAAIFNADGTLSGGTASASVAWGSITGTLSNQTDLQAALDAKVPVTRTVNGHALSANVTVTASDVGLGNVTNDAQTKAAIVPNTVPAAGQILVGNAGGTAFAPVTMSGGATINSAGVVTVPGGASATPPYLVVSSLNYGPASLLTPPGAVGTYTLVNQGGATFTAQNGAIYIFGPSGGTNLRMAVIASPVVAYTATALILATLGNNNTRVGICQRDSGGGKVITWALWAQASGVPGLEFASWNSATSFAANTGNGFGSGPSSSTGQIWLRIVDDTVNRTVQWSSDGVTFLTFSSNASNQFTTTNQIGVFVNGDSAGPGAAGAWISWVVTTP